MDIITQIIGIVWCSVCIGVASWTIIEYITLKNKKL